MVFVSNREIQGEGTPESAWLPWLAARKIPALSLADLCPPEMRLVVIAPHPDDEILMCGGLLARRARCGLMSLVIAVTDGEASHGDKGDGALKRLGALRSQERCAGLKELGLASSCVSRLGIPDGKALNLIHTISQELILHLRPLDRVVSTWELDGHPDHEACGRAAKEASAVVGCGFVQVPVWMWHWAQPDDVRIPWSSLRAFDLHEQALSSKQAALLKHQSQLTDRLNGSGPVLVPSIVARASRVREYFFY